MESRPKREQTINVAMMQEEDRIESYKKFRYYPNLTRTKRLPATSGDTI
jgi:hypothetical protein